MSDKKAYEGILMTEAARREGGVAALFSPSRAAKTAQFTSAATAAWYAALKPPYRLTIIGQGDVGRTLAVGLKLLGSAVLSEIGIYDLDQARLAATEMELNQINGPNFKAVPVVIKDDATLYDSDIVVFTASKSVPPVGAAVGDVRLRQFESNAAILNHYIERAVDCNYGGMFCIMSDPVDLLCQFARQRALQLAAEQLTTVKIRGFGLGVMYARARYYAQRSGYHSFAERGLVFGPHGEGLIAVDDSANFNLSRSKQLAKMAVEANLAVRAAGRKPYIAPALSSGALSIIAMLEGRWQHSAVAFGSVYLGVKNRLTANGIELVSAPYHADLAQWLGATIDLLEQHYETLHFK